MLRERPIYILLDYSYALPRSVCIHSHFALASELLGVDGSHETSEPAMDAGKMAHRVEKQQKTKECSLVVPRSANFRFAFAPPRVVGDLIL